MSVPALDVASVLPRYRHSRKRLVLVDFDAWVTVLRTASPKLGTGEVRAIVHTIKPVRGHGAIDYRQADFATIVRLSFVEPKMW